jgi:hypothetical protein
MLYFNITFDGKYFDITLWVYTPIDNHKGSRQDTLALLWKQLVSNALLK